VSLAELKDRLHLTPEQQRIVAKELDDYVKYYQNIEEEREDVAEHGKARILSILTPEQKKQFLEMFKASALPTKADSDE
jgi:DNA-binding MarR family transcriptional regulator